MPGTVSDGHKGAPDDGPYVPSWCYPNGNPKMCSCGHHEGYHNDKGECLRAGSCGCSGIQSAEVCETCKGSNREMIHFGSGDVRDFECSMCRTHPTPRTPESIAEEILEGDAFVAANDPEVPQYARDLIKELWAEVVAREQWKSR